MWRRPPKPGADGAGSAIPTDAAELADLAETVAAALRAGHLEGSGNHGLEAVEVVRVIEGLDIGQASSPGLTMTWSQGEARFGLIATMSSLVEQAGAAESVLTYLELAIDEPHTPGPDGTRTWFFDLPSH